MAAIWMIVTSSLNTGSFLVGFALSFVILLMLKLEKSKSITVGYRNYAHTQDEEQSDFTVTFSAHGITRGVLRG